jgi:hypothetical protein
MVSVSPARCCRQSDDESRAGRREDPLEGYCGHVMTLVDDDLSIVADDGTDLAVAH